MKRSGNFRSLVALVCKDFPETAFVRLTEEHEITDTFRKREPNRVREAINYKMRMAVRTSLSFECWKQNLMGFLELEAGPAGMTPW